jgi:hypothetical protein
VIPRTLPSRHAHHPSPLFSEVCSPSTAPILNNKPAVHMPGQRGDHKCRVTFSTAMTTESDSRREEGTAHSAVRPPPEQDLPTKILTSDPEATLGTDRTVSSQTTHQTSADTKSPRSPSAVSCGDRKESHGQRCRVFDTIYRAEGPREAWVRSSGSAGRSRVKRDG